MLRDEGALRADLLVERVEDAFAVAVVAAARPTRRLGLGDSGAQPLGLVARVLHHLRRDRRLHAGQLGLLPEQRELLVGERVQAAQALLHLLESEG